jgi:hypothetical protein
MKNTMKNQVAEVVHQDLKLCRDGGNEMNPVSMSADEFQFVYRRAVDRIAQALDYELEELNLNWEQIIAIAHEGLDKVLEQEFPGFTSAGLDYRF